jgi:hypothetical protein
MGSQYLPSFHSFSKNVNQSKNYALYSVEEVTSGYQPVEGASLSLGVMPSDRGQCQHQETTKPRHRDRMIRKAI